MSSNPLQKYFRQPKLYISLPSKGLFYKEGSLIGDSENVPILAMSGMDEIIMKTPDALFNGEATIKLIESCCPYIKDAKYVPSLDIDVLLTSIRIATFGNTMSVKHTCSKCKNVDDLEVNLSNIIDHYSGKVFKNKISINDNIVINIRPLSYQEVSKFNVENFKLQKMLLQIESIESEEEKQKYFDTIYQQLANIQVDLFIDSIESVQVDNETVTEKEFIKEWLSNTESSDYKEIKNTLEKNKKEWSIPSMKVKCSSCEHEEFVEITLDQSSFF